MIGLLVDFPFHFGAGFAYEDVQVCTQVGLLHVIEIDLNVAPFGVRFGRRPGSFSASEFFIGNIEMKAAVGYIQFYHVPILYQGQGTSNGSFGRDVQYDSAVSGTASCVRRKSGPCP